MTTRYEIRRTRLVRKVQMFSVEMPDEMDPSHLIDNHTEEFDIDLCAGGDVLNGWTAEQTVEAEEEPDDQFVTLRVIDGRPANVIRMSDRRKS